MQWSRKKICGVSMLIVAQLLLVFIIDSSTADGWWLGKGRTNGPSPRSRPWRHVRAHPTLVSSSAIAHNGNSPALSGGFYLVYISPTLGWGKTSHNCNQTWHDVWADDNRPAFVIVINEPFWLMIIAIVWWRDQVMIWVTWQGGVTLTRAPDRGTW